MRLQNHRITVFIFFVIIFGIILFAFYASIKVDVFPQWTGFPRDTVPEDSLTNGVMILDQDRDLWDWLQLLLVPLVLAVGGYLLTRTENRYALELQERREQEARLLEKKRSEDAAFQSHLDYMTVLTLDKGLKMSKEKDEIRSVARARTLTVLKQIDGDRKGWVIQFLYGARLIGYYEEKTLHDSIIDLSDADLSKMRINKDVFSGINLSRTNLKEANLEDIIIDRANFEGADLEDAILKNTSLFKTNMSWTKMQGVNLRSAFTVEADFSYALLKGAVLTRARLKNTKFLWADLRGAKLIMMSTDNTMFDFANLTDAEFSKDSFFSKAFHQISYDKWRILKMNTYLKVAQERDNNKLLQQLLQSPISDISNNLRTTD